MKKWIYNRNGQAVALDCGDSVYDQNGNFALWIHGHNLYNQDGDHVGWTEGGVFYDSNNDVIGFTRDHTQHLPSNPGYGGTPGIPGLEWKLGRPCFEGEPGRLGYGGWSSIDFEDYIEEC